MINLKSIFGIKKPVKPEKALVIIYKSSVVQPTKEYSKLLLSPNRKHQFEDDRMRVMSYGAALMGLRFNDLIIITDYESYSTDEFLEYIKIVKTRMYPESSFKILIEA